MGWLCPTPPELEGKIAAGNRTERHPLRGQICRACGTDASGAGDDGLEDQP